MPAAIGSAIAAWAATITVSKVVLFVASMALNSMMASRAKKKAEAAQRAAGDAARSQYNSTRVDRTQVIRSGVEPRNIVLGRDEVSGPLACWFTYGAGRNFHMFAIVLAGHECDGVETVLFNHEPVTLDETGAVIGPAKYVRTITGTGTFEFPAGPAGTVYTLVHVPGRMDAVVSGGGTIPYSLSGNQVTILADTPDPVFITYTVTQAQPLFRFKFYLGAPGQQASPELMQAAAAAGVPGSWDASRKGTGICYAVGYMEADFNILGQIGVPNFSFIIRGAKAVDRRVGGAPTWTQNPAVLSDWFVVHSGFAPKTLPEEVNEPELFASANVSDEVIQLSASASGPRYLCNGQLTSAASPLDNLNHILDAMDGDAVWVSGQWQIVAGYYKTPTLTIHERSLSSAGISIAPRRPKRDLFNGIKGTFVSAAAGYTRVGYDMVTSEVYQAEDGGELLQADANFELVNDSIRCQMIAWQRLTRARQPLTVQLGTNLRGYDTSPLQNIEVNLRRPGYTNKVFANLSRQYEKNKLVYVLQETGPEVWEWDYTKSNAAVDLPNTSLPDVITLPAPPTGIVTESGSDALQKLGDGTVLSRVRIRWEPLTNTYVVNSGKIEWQHKSASTTADEWTALPPVPGSDVEIFTGAVIDGETILLRGRSVTGQGRKGNWSPLVSCLVIGKTERPDAPTGVSLTQESVFCRPAQLAADVLGFLVRSAPGILVNPTRADFMRATKLHEGRVLGFPWPFATRLYGVQTVMIVAEDSSIGADGYGNLSDVGSSSLDFGQPSDQNIGQVFDYRAAGWPGTKQNCSVVSGDLVADADPGSDLNVLSDWNGEPDLNATLLLPMVYTAQPFVPVYGGGTLLFDIATEGPQSAVEYRVAGSAINNLNDLADWNSEADLNGASSEWSPWPGALQVQRGYTYEPRVSISGGSEQPKVTTFTAKLALQRGTQSFPPMAISASGTRLNPADGLPPVKWVSVQSVSMLPEVDGSGAVSGRFLDLSAEFGPLVQQVNSSGIPVDSRATSTVGGTIDV